ncbi:MAG: hypothetical protein NT023_05725 [Armatimonadetes bacterium]|nr:hypothetical protein [Armatimonadota bacterium]
MRVYSALNRSETNSLDIIRSETALRYPFHNLSTSDNIHIAITKKDERGTITFSWEVAYNNKYGQPGRLAYKLDTHVINRRIDEATKGRQPVPQFLKLGSLREIAEELNLGTNTNAVKKALHQNASAYLTIKGLRYEAKDQTQQTFEFGDTRYGVRFVGEKLPGGGKADAVYIVFHEDYRVLLDKAKTRPLDYDYLRDLSPAAQRFYEIVSYEMLPAIKFGQRAKLPYSEFCLFSTMTRNFTFDEVKKQMWKIHKPHIVAEYIEKVEYEATIDEEGQPDWNMFYVPGETAKRQQLVFDFKISYTHRERVRRSPKPKTPIVLGPVTPELPLIHPTASADLVAKDLVRRFYKLRYGVEQPPTEREILEASSYLAESEDWAAHLIEFSARHGKEANGFPNDFGGVKKLISQAREPYETKHRERDALVLKKARQSHQKAHTASYMTFIGELLGGRLETSLPEAFQLFKEQEDSTYRFHKARSDKSAMSAHIIEGYYQADQRITRLIKFIEENPKSGIPNFWQWDEKINPNPFRPAGQ